MSARGAAACLLVLVGLAACGASDPPSGRDCDPGDALHTAIRDEPVLARADPRPEVGTREGVRSTFDSKTGQCTPIVLSRTWDLDGVEPAQRLDLLTGELTAAGWLIRAMPSPQPSGLGAGPFVLARDFQKQIGRQPVTLAISYRSGAPALTGLVRVPVDASG